jgi:hypothetical protein
MWLRFALNDKLFHRLIFEPSSCFLKMIPCHFQRVLKHFGEFEAILVMPTEICEGIVTKRNYSLRYFCE